MLGCGLPGGEQGYNIGPGGRGRCSATTTLPGHDGHPLLLVVAADHPDGVPRDQGRRGRRVHLGRCRNGVAASARAARDCCPDTQNPLFAGAEAAHRAARPQGGGRLARPARGRRAARRLHRDGPDRGERRRSQGRQPGRQDEFGVRSQNLAEKAIANGFWEREITPVTLPDGTVVSTDDGPRAGVTPGSRLAAQAGVPARRHGHRRQLLPAQRRRGRGGHHERHARPPSWASRRWPGSWRPGSRRFRPEIMGLGPVEATRRALALAGMRSATSTWSRSTRRSPRRCSRRSATGHRPRPAQRQRRRDRGRPPVRHDRRPDHHHADQLAAVPRQAVRPGDHVRRRRPGHGDDHRAAELTLTAVEPPDGPRAGHSRRMPRFVISWECFPSRSTLLRHSLRSTKVHLRDRP